MDYVLEIAVQGLAISARARMGKLEEPWSANPRGTEELSSINILMLSGMLLCLHNQIGGRGPDFMTPEDKDRLVDGLFAEWDDVSGKLKK